MSKEFKKGDRVKLLQNVDGAKGGMIGTCMNRDGCYAIPVEFDEKIKEGHSCNGRTREGNGYWILPEDLELFTPPHAFTLVITSKGDRTKAKFLHGKEIVQTAEVNRYKDDEYSQPAAIREEVAMLDKFLQGEVYTATLEKKTHIYKEEKCPHCGEVISTSEWDDWEEVEFASGFYGYDLEENGILHDFCNGLHFKEEVRPAKLA